MYIIYVVLYITYVNDTCMCSTSDRNVPRTSFKSQKNEKQVFVFSSFSVNFSKRFPLCSLSLFCTLAKFEARTLLQSTNVALEPHSEMFRRNLIEHAVDRGHLCKVYGRFTSKLLYPSSKL